MLECVVNVSEGTRPAAIEALRSSAAGALLDLHSDAAHNRSVLTLGGPRLSSALRSLSETAVSLLTIDGHTGAHPRMGVLDVVPFVPLGSGGEPLPDADLGPAVEARDAFARWAGASLDLPCFFYGPERTLPELRRQAFTKLRPDTGPQHPHSRAGATCVGARPPLVAYNIWLEDHDLELARSVARSVRSPAVRALGLDLGSAVQVSCNLVAPWSVGPGRIFDAVRQLARVERAELVGLVPRDVLRVEPGWRWAELDLDESRTVEARLSALPD